MKRLTILTKHYSQSLPRVISDPNSIIATIFHHNLGNRNHCVDLQIVSISFKVHLFKKTNIDPTVLGFTVIAGRRIFFSHFVPFYLKVCSASGEVKIMKLFQWNIKSYSQSRCKISKTLSAICPEPPPPAWWMCIKRSVINKKFKLHHIMHKTLNKHKKTFFKVDFNWTDWLEFKNCIRVVMMFSSEICN